MNRPIPLALVTVVSWFGCGGDPAPEQTTSSTTTAPAEAPPEEEAKAPTSGTVDDEAAGPTVVAQSTSLEVPIITLDEESIRRVIRAELPEIRKCYEAGLLRKPELSGTVTASFLVDAAGAVASSSASGLGDAQVESCIASLLRRVRFPADENRGPVIVNYPFNLRPTPD